MAKGKIPFTESFPKFSFTAMGCTAVQLPQCYFPGGYERKLFPRILYDHIPCFIQRGSKKQHNRHFLTINSTAAGPGRELLKMVFSGPIDMCRQPYCFLKMSNSCTCHFFNSLIRGCFGIVQMEPGNLGSCLFLVLMGL